MFFSTLYAVTDVPHLLNNTSSFAAASLQRRQFFLQHISLLAKVFNHGFHKDSVAFFIIITAVTTIITAMAVLSAIAASSI